ncbi:MAG TPA: glycosyltransferase family 2 protein [bacterium]|nr:glycosyltransferase family 2 protein [bacterium]
MDRVWILVTVFNRLDSLPNFFQNLNQQDYNDFIVILIDHGTRHIEDQSLPSYVIHLKKPSDKWWTGPINDGLKYLFSRDDLKDNDFIMLQNDDVKFGPTFISDLVNISKREKAIVGAITIDPNTRKIVDADNKFSILRANHICAKRGKDLQEVGVEPIPSDILKGRGVIYPVKVVRDIGFLNEKLRRRSDPEWAYRAKKRGYKVLIAPSVVVESVIGTDIKLEGKISVKDITNYLFSPKSTANLPDALTYFFACLGPLKGSYCVAVYTLRIFLIVFLKYILSIRKS